MSVQLSFWRLTRDDPTKVYEAETTDMRERESSFLYLENFDLGRWGERPVSRANAAQPVSTWPTAHDAYARTH